MINIRKITLFLVSILCTVTVIYAQSDDFAVRTKFKVNHKIDPRFSVFGDLEFRTEDRSRAVDRFGLAFGGDYNVYPFLKLSLGYETHYRNLGESEWKFRHRYHIGATASFQYQWLKGFSEREISADI